MEVDEDDPRYDPTWDSFTDGPTRIVGGEKGENSVVINDAWSPDGSLELEMECPDGKAEAHFTRKEIELIYLHLGKALAHLPA